MADAHEHHFATSHRPSLAHVYSETGCRKSWKLHTRRAWNVKFSICAIARHVTKRQTSKNVDAILDTAHGMTDRTSDPRTGDVIVK